jgi:hypothetical protein
MWLIQLLGSVLFRPARSSPDSLLLISLSKVIIITAVIVALINTGGPCFIFLYCFVACLWRTWTCPNWTCGVQQDCPNGRLTPAKFVDMYKMFFPNGNAEEFCDHVFRTFDMDKNGFIDFKVSIICSFNDILPT